MISILAAAGFLLLSTVQVNAVAIYGQCGGINYSGSTTCDPGLTCVYMNDYYSQCLASTTTAPTTSTTRSSTTKTSSSSTTSVSSTPVSGYVKTSGQKFTLNGATYTVAGTNAYWLAQLGSTSDIDKAFSDIAAAGFTTVRTWGFNDVTSPSGTYYQLWSNGVGTLNTGSSGLGKFDTVVAAAKTYGLRLIVTLTNNWSDYGGMDVYTSQIVGSGQYHDVFYTNANVIAAYKKYISGFVGHYVNEPGIFAWELANEPRCGGSSTSASPSCTTSTITTWAGTISAYIKSIDSNHLVAIGDEGFFNEPSNPLYPYQGSEGIDYVANLAIKTLDFGTFHLYPVSWGQTSDPVGFGTQWIKDHATAQVNANKPSLVEEYGVTSAQDTTYQTWGAAIVSSGLTGELYWQAGSYLSNGATSNDGYAIYPDSAAYPVLETLGQDLKARG